MVDYKKIYAKLVGRVDEALTVMDTDNLLEFQRVKEILQNALEEAEEEIIGDEEY